MRLLCAALVCFMGIVAEGANKSRIRVIGGEEVSAGPSFTAGPLVEVRGLKFYACKLKRNEADCTVITGYIVSKAPHNRYVVTLDIDFYETYANSCHRGTARAEIDRPVPGRPVAFQCLGPAWFTAKATGLDKRPVKAHYTVRTSLRGYKPPKFEPPPVGNSQ